MKKKKTSATVKLAAGLGISGAAAAGLLAYHKLKKAKTEKPEDAPVDESVLVQEILDMYTDQ